MKQNRFGKWMIGISCIFLIFLVGCKGEPATYLGTIVDFEPTGWGSKYILELNNGQKVIWSAPFLREEELRIGQKVYDDDGFTKVLINGRLK